MDRRKIIGDSAFLTAASFLTQLKGLILIPIAIGYIGLKNYGAYVQIMVNISMLSPICQLGMGQGFYRYCSKQEQNRLIRKEYWTILIATFLLAVLGSVAIYTLSPVIGDRILKGDHLKTLRLSALLLITAILYSINCKFIISRKDFKFFSIFSVIYSSVPFVGLVAGIIWYKSLFFGLILNLLLEIFFNLILFAYIVKQFKPAFPDRKILYQYVRYSAPLTLSSFTGGILSKVDRYFIGIFLGPSAIGIYNIIYSLCSILEQLQVPFAKYFLVYLPKIWDLGDREQVINQLKKGLLYYLIVSIGCAMLITEFGKPLVQLFLGNSIRVISNFEIIAILIGIGIVSLGMVRFFYYLTTYKEKTYLQIIFQCFGASVHLILNWMLIPKYGLIGAATATVVSYVSIIFACNWFLEMNLTKEFLWKLSRILVAGLVIISVCRIFGTETLMGLAISLLISITSYFLLVILFRVVSIKELKSLSGIL
jgi:O-antigen/teichoic acid export membrane protein